MKVDNNTYFTSDPHYGHKNVVKGISEWDDSANTRDFQTLEEHNDALVDRINSKVPENGTLICLGDWSFGGIENIWNFRKRINCKNIHLILGNHDHHIENNQVLPNVERISIPSLSELTVGKTGKKYLKSTDEKPVDLFRVKAQELFTSVSHYKEIQFKKDGYTYDIILSHYAMRVWNKSHRGSIHLYGHSHGTLQIPTSIRSMDIGVDTNNLYPYHIEEIIDMMKDRPIGFEIDHHINKSKYNT